MILRNKVDIVNGVTAAGNGDGEMSLTVDQVFCTRGGAGAETEDKNAKLVSLATVLKHMEAKQAELLEMLTNEQEVSKRIEETLPNKAEAANLTEVGTKLNTVCGNLDHLLESFHTAGLLEQEPISIAETPPLPEEDASQEEEDAEKTSTNNTEETEGENASEASVKDEAGAEPDDTEEIGSEAQQETVDFDNVEAVITPTDDVDLAQLEIGEAISRIRSTYKSAATGYFHVNNGLIDLKNRFEKEIDALARDTTSLRNQQEENVRVLETKVDIEIMDKRVEQQFDKVIDKLDTAVRRAGDHEEKFKQSLKEIRETCNQVSVIISFDAFIGALNCELP